MSAGFNGFSEEGIKFLKDLSSNNTRGWFHQNKNIYDEQLVIPAKKFVTAMGDRLRKISPGIVADPAVNKSLFRLNRDTRFSSDKTPYKTQFSMFFWEGDRKRMENPGYYMCFDAQKLTLAGGFHEFPREKLEPFRRAVISDRSGKELVKIAESFKRKGIEVKGEHYKRTPRGYDLEHPRAAFLKFNGLYIISEVKLPAQIHSGGFVAYCARQFTTMDPLQRWLVNTL